MMKRLQNLVKPKLELLKGTRFISFLFIGSSALIAAGILWAANTYYNIDTGEVVTEEIQRVTGVLRATGRLIVGGTAAQNPAAGYGFESATSSLFSAGDVVLSGAGQLLRFTGATSFYVGFRATTTISTTTVYTWPTVYPDASGRVLQSTTGGVMSWLDLGAAGLGDVTAVGDCPSGECFTSAGTSGSALWFYQGSPGPFRLQLTRATLSADRTITLPDATGTVALGTSTANYVAYWTSTSTLAGEAQLAVSRGGTGRGSWTQWGVLYAPTTTSLDNTAAGTNFQILTANTGAAPTWRNISDLVTATNGLTITGTATSTIKLGGTLTETTTVTSTSTFDMIFNLAGTGDFRVQDAGTDILTVRDDGVILFKTYPLAQSGKQVLREMIPIFGFDLPAQTATTSYVKISRTVAGYPFSPADTGSTRVHRFVIRYTDNLPLASSTNWRVATTTGSAFSTFTLPGRNNSALDSGTATTTPDVAIPTDGTGWWLEVQSLAAYPNNSIRVFQIFLAAYDQIQ